MIKAMTPLTRLRAGRHGVSARLRDHYRGSPWVIQAGRVAARPRPAIPGTKACPDFVGCKIARLVYPAPQKLSLGNQWHCT